MAKPGRQEVYGGEFLPDDAAFADWRRGSDVELGQSIYEPFGIAQIEPMSYGAISVVSDICGCLGFVDRVADRSGLAGFIEGACLYPARTERGCAVRGFAE